MQPLSTDPYTPISTDEFIVLLVNQGVSALMKVLEHQPELITPVVLDRFSKIINSENPTEAPYRINNIIWNLAKIWNRINYRCFLWALYADFGETIRSLHQESTVINENTLFYKSEFSNVISLEDYDQEVIADDQFDYPLMPQIPTDKEYNFLYNLYINNNYPLELYKYIKPQLSEEQVHIWRSLCQEKIIIAKTIHKDFWVMSGSKLKSLQIEFVNALCQRYLNLSEDPNRELSSYYLMTLKEHHQLNKNFAKELDKEITPDDSSAFNMLSQADKREVLRDKCISHLNGSKLMDLEHRKYLALYNIKSSHEDNEGRTIAIFRLLPFLFNEITEFNILFRNEVEQYIFKLYLVNHYPSFFKFLANTNYFNLNWFINLDFEDQIRIVDYYKEVLLENLNRIYRESPEIATALIKTMDNDQLEELSVRNLTLALRYKWKLSREYLETMAKTKPLTFFTTRDAVDIDLLWIAALASPKDGFQYVADLFSPEQVQQLRELKSAC